MKKLLPLFLLIFVLTACDFIPSVRDTSVSTAVTVCNYYDPEQLDIFTRNTSPDFSLSGICAAVVPHYAPELDMLCRVLASIEKAPDTFVIIAPDHPAKNDITVSFSDWSIGGDMMYCDAALAQGISDDLSFTLSSGLDGEEWSASTLLPYIKHYFPASKIVIIYLSRSASAEKLQSLAEYLALQENIFVLGSADFSHYESYETAVENDSYIRGVIENMDTGTLLHLGNEYVDSPQTVSVIIKYAAELGKNITQCDSAVDVYCENGEKLAGSYQMYAVK